MVTDRRNPLTRKLQDEFKYEGDSRDFERLLWTTFTTNYPGFTIDELLCKPSKSLEYVRTIRAEMNNSKLPEFLICKALINTRKSERYKLYQ
jgi:hypothetical protein